MPQLHQYVGPMAERAYRMLSDDHRTIRWVEGNSWMQPNPARPIGLYFPLSGPGLYLTIPFGGPWGRVRQTCALVLHDFGYTFEQVAEICGYLTNGVPHAGTASHAYRAAATREAMTGSKMTGHHTYRANWRERVVPPRPNRSTITFGVELECPIPSDCADEIYSLLEDRGLPVETSHYRGSNYRVWQVKTDGSVHDVHGDCYGLEVVSPILRGEVGLASLSTVMDLLTGFCEDRDWVASNRTCGMHVHIGVNRWTSDAIANLVALGGYHETEMRRYVNPWRTSNHSTYCKMWAPTRLEGVIHELRNASTLSTDRYMTVNVEAYPTHGTIEFRAHEGTLSSIKARTWVRFLLALAELAQDIDPAELTSDATADHDVGWLLDKVTERGLVPAATAQALAARSERWVEA